MSAMYDEHGEDKSLRWRSFIIQGVKGMNICPSRFTYGSVLERSEWIRGSFSRPPHLISCDHAPGCGGNTYQNPPSTRGKVMENPPDHSKPLLSPSNCPHPLHDDDMPNTFPTLIGAQRGQRVRQAYQQLVSDCLR